MTAPLLLSVRGLSVTLSVKGQTIRAVEDVSFDLAAGRTLALVGESGSGKSMTAMSVIGLGPAGTDISTRGQALFEGRDLLALPPAELRRIRGRRIGAIFQDPASALNPLMTIARQIAEAARAADTGTRRQAVRDLLREVGLDNVPEIEGRYPHELSGGQQQRVMIAIALAGNPDLLVADEPTTALDMTVQAQILALLRRLQEARRMAILMISHDLGVVSRLARDVVILRAGRVVEQGPTKVVLSRPSDDYTRALIACSPRVGARRARLMTIDMIRRGVMPRPRPASAVKRAPILEVEGLTVRYPGRGLLAPPTVAVADAQIAVPRSNIVGIVGESGSGKSTLARALVGLVQPQFGTIRFEDRMLHDPRRLDRNQRRHIQYIFQDPYGALNPRMTVRQALAEPLDIHGLHLGPGRSSAITRLMDEVELAPDLIERYPHELSGGQRQRVTIARALALEPTLLICDEVVSALDVSVQAQVLNLLSDLQEARGLSLLFISHDLAVVSHLCDRVVIMSAGRVVEEGEVDRVFERPTSPVTAALLAAAAALETEGMTQDQMRTVRHRGTKEALSEEPA